MGKLISVERARELVLECAEQLESESVPASEATGRTLAGDLLADHDVPGFDSSAMDGFAVRARDTSGAGDPHPVVLKLTGESRAGSPARHALGDGEAIAISTGAMMPAGADAVVRVEDTGAIESGGVPVTVAVEPGRDVRLAGEDLTTSERAIPSGTLIGPPELAVCAGIGRSAIDCFRRPRLASLTTGDELVDAAQPLQPGQIHNSNGPAIAALARAQGAELVQQVSVGDDRDTTIAALEKALDADVVVVTGGVSVGPHDHVKPALAERGVEQIFWGVALRPGKPTWFGRRADTLVFGLPGNPVSAMVTFHLFVRPALAAMQGRTLAAFPLIARIAAPYEKQPGRSHVLRARVTGAAGAALEVEPTKQQGSHVLSSMIGADALAYVDAERGNLVPGDMVPIELLPEFVLQGFRNVETDQLPS